MRPNTHLIPAAILALGVLAAVVPARSSAASPAADRLSVRHGDLYYRHAGKTTRLTTGGHVGDCDLSLDHRWIAYVWHTPGRPIDTNIGPGALGQVRIIGTDGKHGRALVTTHDAKEVEDLLAGLTSPCFSPDAKTVYFLSQAYAVSDALHAVDVATGKQRFICDANTVRVVTTNGYGYRGDLVVNRHKYFIAGGSYDWFWLITPEGKEIGPVGPEDTDELE